MKAAFGRINLTPDDYRGKALAGYGNWCYGKLDDIHGSVILFENKGNTMLLLTLDFLKFPISFTDYLKLKIKEKFHIFEAFSGLPKSRASALMTIITMISTLENAYRPGKSINELVAEMELRFKQLGGEIKTNTNNKMILSLIINHLNY